MIEFHQACDLIFHNTPRLGTEKRLIEDAIGCVLAQEVISPISVTPFRNSAMDGFAVQSRWLAGCSAERPLPLPIGATSFAGDSVLRPAADKEALKVMTGARVPEEFDAVIPFEDTDYSQDEVRFRAPAVPGQHIREAGEDIVRGQRLYSAGTVIGALDVGILATVGLRSVLTYRRPSLTVAATGDELTNPGEELACGSVYDANSFTILSLVAPYCDRVQRVSRVPDKPVDLEKLLASPSDVIVCSGGVSAGERDLVVDVAESSGWQRVFHKVRIKPGKPVYFAVRDKQILLGLPGNPLSAAVTCSVFLIPALRKMSGFDDYRLHPTPARLPREEFRKSNRKLIWPGFIEQDSSGTVARYSPKESSAALTALLGTDGLIIQDTSNREHTEVAVEVIPWSHILTR